MAQYVVDGMSNNTIIICLIGKSSHGLYMYHPRFWLPEEYSLVVVIIGFRYVNFGAFSHTGWSFQTRKILAGNDIWCGCFSLNPVLEFRRYNGKPG